ncbi:MAG TPA: DUF805 domain-containing protein, partial [Bryobacteraceae bacterium]
YSYPPALLSSADVSSGWWKTDLTAVSLASEVRPMYPIRCVAQAFRRAFDFTDRSSRSETWWYLLFLVAMVLGATMLDHWLGTPKTTFGTGAFRFGIAVVLFFPTLSLATRRFHDVGLSGWWIVLYWAIGVVRRVAILGNRNLGGTPDNTVSIVIGFVGWVAVALALIVLALPGMRGRNRYGQDPLDRTDFAEVFK